MNLDQLKNNITELENFREEINREQLVFPLDSMTKKNILIDIPTPSDRGETVFPSSLPNYNQAIQVSINDKKYWLLTTEVQ